MRAFALLAVLCVAAVAADTSMSTMPLFVWGGQGSIEQNPKSADAALASVLTKSDTEMVLAYMFDETSTQQMQDKKAEFVQLESVLTNAASSAFTALEVSKCTTEGLLATARVNSATGVEVDAGKLQKYLDAHSVLMTDGKPDVIVVRFGTMDAAEADAVIGAAEKAVSAATSGRFNSILSTTSSMEPGVATNLAFSFFQSVNLRSSPQFSTPPVPMLPSTGAYPTAAALTGATALGALFPTSGVTSSARHALWYGGVAYLTPNLVIAILIMIYMGVLLLCAYCCILSLQTPEKFEGDQEKDMARALNQDAK